MTQPFPRAFHDMHFDEKVGPVLYRNGEETLEVDIEWYFDVVGNGEDSEWWLESRLDGPLLDMGAGVGRHALYFQKRFETVAIEQNKLLVDVMQDRGVEDARVTNMFDLRGSFERDQFRSAIAIGTQVGLAGSMEGLRAFLCDLAFVTTHDATAVIDGYDPEHEATKKKIDYRSDPAPGLAYRILQVEYDSTLGEPWLYRLFTPAKIREAVLGSGWKIAEVKYGKGKWDNIYNVVLEKC